MKTVTITYLRYNMGAMFYEIKSRGEQYLLTHAGKPIARLLPLTDDIEVLPDGTFKNGKPLTHRKSFMSKKSISIAYVSPPIGTRDYDWRAMYEGEEEENNYGYGNTPFMALTNLIHNNTPEWGKDA